MCIFTCMLKVTPKNKQIENVFFLFRFHLILENSDR